MVFDVLYNVVCFKRH